MALQLRRLRMPLLPAALCCAVLCFAAGACEGYDVMPMTDGHGDTTPPPQPTEEAGGWMLCQQDKARGGEVEKLRRLTYAHGWQCGHKLIIMGIAFELPLVEGSLLHCYHCTVQLNFFLGTPSVLEGVSFLLSEKSNIFNFN